MLFCIIRIALKSQQSGSPDFVILYHSVLVLCSQPTFLVLLFLTAHFYHFHLDVYLPSTPILRQRLPLP